MDLSTKLDLRLSPAARQAVDTLAQRHGRTRGAEVRAAVEAWVEFHRPATWLDADEEDEK